VLQTFEADIRNARETDTEFAALTVTGWSNWKQP